MGEQPKPVDDEVERALASMRAGFLSASEQIAASVASLEEHLVDVPNEERSAVRAAVGRLVATHERIVAKVADLPASPWDSFKALVSAVKAQQAVLDQISHLVKEHVLPRQLENLSVTPFPGTLPAAEEEPLLRRADDPFPPRHGFEADDGSPPDGGFLSDHGFRGGGGAYPGDSGFVPDDALFPGDGFRPEAGPAFRPQSDAGLHPRAHGGARGRPETGYPALARAGLRVRGDVDDDDAEPRSLLALVRERTAGFRGLAAMLAVGIVLSVFPREKLQEAGAILFELVGARHGEPVAAEGRPPTQPAAAAAPRSVARVPSASDAAAAPSAAPVAAAPLEKQPAAPTAPVAAAPPEKQRAAPSREDVPAVAQPVPIRAAVQAASTEPAAPPASVAEQRFVPVVFTHKDHATVMRALSDLKEQYPNILIGMQAEVQPVDLGRKGIWHRLVFLPAGPRPQAARVCDQLAAEGYDRCWVKAY